MTCNWVSSMAMATPLATDMGRHRAANMQARAQKPRMKWFYVIKLKTFQTCQNIRMS